MVCEVADQLSTVYLSIYHVRGISVDEVHKKINSRFSPLHYFMFCDNTEKRKERKCYLFKFTMHGGFL